MGEIGTVIKKTNNKVTLELLKNEACKSCMACTMGAEGKVVTIEAVNKCSAKIGDEVELYLDNQNFLHAVIIMYILPLIALFIGLFVGFLLSKVVPFNAELTSITIGFLFTISTYLIIKKNENRFKTAKFTPVAKRIVKKE